MQEPDQNILEQQKKAAAFLTRKRIPFEPKSAETLAAEAKAEAEEQARLEAEFWAVLHPSDTMPDGSIFVDVSSESGKRLFAMPADASLKMTFNQAVEYAARLNHEKTLGYDDWRLPTRNELDALFKNAGKGTLKSTFNQANADGMGNWYWSSTPYLSISNAGVWYNDRNDKRDLYTSPVRLVRG